MLPQPNMPFPLRGIIENMGGVVPNSPQSKVSDDAQFQRYNPHALNAEHEATEESRGTALNLLHEASLLENDARVKREKAYRLAPDMRPVMAVQPETLPIASKDVTEEVAAEAEPAPAPKKRAARKG
jgi:hypothetical protein